MTQNSKNRSDLSTAKAQDTVNSTKLATRPPTGIIRSTASRLVRFLAAMDYLSQVGESRKYRLGLAALDLGQRGGILVFERVGGMISASCRCNTEAILAGMSVAEQTAYLARNLEKIGKKTIVDLDQLPADMKITRKRGYSVSFQETYDFTVGVGAAFMGADG